MGRIFNFGAGPSMLPLPVLEQAQAELLDYKGSGMSVMEISCLLYTSPSPRD